ncbi:MAG: purine-nucleoside phosphorylase [Vallitaleaceae bacterium]|jgi:purine-nucleoside phosphorylase|nr:purine-nucleoside phosphorylase [Vallitaleaceae bacterium]
MKSPHSQEKTLPIPTPHIEVDRLGIIADTVLMPGDPLRAKYIAENYLENPVQFNSVRNMLGYTGTYKGKKISVMGSGMGMASIGIYSHELYAFYDVKRIIRIGSCGAYSKDLNVYDVLLVDSAWSESSFAKAQGDIDDDVMLATPALNDEIAKVAERLGTKIHRGRIHSSDVFYRKNFKAFETIRDEHDCLAVEMESFALFEYAKVLGKEASCILTVSDSLVSGQVTTSEERQKAFTKMMEIALEMA